MPSLSSCPLLPMLASSSTQGTFLFFTVPIYKNKINYHIYKVLDITIKCASLFLSLHYSDINLEFLFQPLEFMKSINHHCHICKYHLESRYLHCDPITSGLVSTKDQLLPLFVMDILGHVPGFVIVTHSFVFVSFLYNTNSLFIN